MRIFRDFLVWYNNLDVKPIREAIGKQSQIYRDKGIDMLKSAISLSGLASDGCLETLVSISLTSVWPDSQSLMETCIGHSEGTAQCVR